MQYYGYIYLITNNINNRRYVGQHKYAGYPNKDPNYHGGGHLLKKAYNKYGRENEQANKFEKELTLKYKADIGTRWYNNGERNIRARECPEGYKLGVVRRKP